MRRAYQPSYRLKKRNLRSLVAGKLRPLRQDVEALADIAAGLRKDAARSLGLRKPRAPVVTPMAPPASDSGRWCLYAAYSPKAVISEMVLTQLREYCDAGFNVVFISMSRSVSDKDAARLRNVCTHLIQRQSHGRDFGAWAECVRLLRPELLAANALLLTNDSSLGPLRPLRPWIDKCLVGEGVFGLTESLGGGSHIQSYFLLGNGERAIGSMLDFLDNLKLSYSKFLMIQRGEIAFTQQMVARGNYVGAVLDSETIEEAVLSNPQLQSELRVIFPGFFRDRETRAVRRGDARQADPLEQKLTDRYELRAHLFQLPVNPTHQLNSVLLGHFEFPFVKVELVTKNPGMVPSAPDWRYFITPESPVTEEQIDDHLATL